MNMQLSGSEVSLIKRQVVMKNGLQVYFKKTFNLQSISTF